MKRITGVLLCVFAVHASAQELEEVIVTSSAIKKTLDELVTPVTVLTGEELQREVGATIGETLHGQAGVVNSTFGPGVGTPIIRGQAGNRVELLQNSGTVMDVSDTSSDHAVTVEPLLAKGVEVLRGPAILRYGNGAIGGVVNVVDNRIPREPIDGIGGALQFRYNDNNDGHVVVGKLEGGNGDWAFHLDGVTRESDDISIPGLADRSVDDVDETSDGVIENTGMDADSGTAGVAWHGENWVVGFAASQLDNRYGIPAGVHAHHDHEDEHEDEHDDDERVEIDMEQTRLDFFTRWVANGRWLDQVSLEVSSTDYEHTELEIAEGEVEPGTSYFNDAIQARVELLHKEYNGWRGAGGLQLTETDLEAKGAEAFVPPAKTQETGLYWIEEKSIGALTIELGARIGEREIDSPAGDFDHNTFNFSTTLGYQVSEKNRVGVTLGRAERAPEAEELLADGEHVATQTYDIGDPRLDTEKSVNLDISWFFESESVDFSVSGYLSNFSDYIYQSDTGLVVDEETESCRSPEQLTDPEAAGFECWRYLSDDAEFYGIELELDYRLTEQLTAGMWLDLVRGELDKGGDIPLLPPARLNLHLEFESGPWTTSLKALFADRQSRAGENQESTDGYTRTDLSLQYRADQWALLFKADNLFDEDIRNASSRLREVAPEPGRAVSAAFTWYFGY